VLSLVSLSLVPSSLVRSMPHEVTEPSRGTLDPAQLASGSIEPAAVEPAAVEPEPIEPAVTQPTAEALRRAAGRFATGVAVISTVDDGHDHAMTVNTLTSVSLDPLRVLVCVERDARFFEAVSSSGFWAISVLAAGARSSASWLATRGRPLAGQFASVPHHRGAVTGAPLVEPALTWLECRTADIFPGGDHMIVVGEVIGLEIPDVVADPALLYYRSAYRELP
jgi:flavin reductase (DIM6/NTAB) family NADH-FMN oxidoreductase RutF